MKCKSLIPKLFKIFFFESWSASVSLSNRASKQKATVHSALFTHTVVVGPDGIEPSTHRL